MHKKPRVKPRLFVIEGLLHEPLDCFVQVCDFLLVIELDGLCHTLCDMVLEEDLTGIVDCRADSGKLDKHLGAVPIAFNHPHHGFQVAAGLCKTMQNCFFVFVNMSMRDTRLMPVDGSVLMDMEALVLMTMRF